MGLHYENLDETTRHFMVEEIERDAQSGNLYLSPWLTTLGMRDWPTLLREAAASGSDVTLAAALRAGNYIEQTAQRRKPKGGYTTYTVPHTAADTMAEGEFNRFYVRGLCRRAIDAGISSLIIYRAKAVMNPRPGSEEKIGTTVDPNLILKDLRESPGVEPALGLPPGPNSGLSAKLPVAQPSESILSSSTE